MYLHVWDLSENLYFHHGQMPSETIYHSVETWAKMYGTVS